jgi:hypothetical protein
MIVGGTVVDVEDVLEVVATVDDVAGTDVLEVTTESSTLVESVDPSELSLQAPSAATNPAARTALPHALFIATPPLPGTSRWRQRKLRGDPQIA